MFSRSLLIVAAAFCNQVVGQTYSACNPLYSTGCPADTALGKAISVDFTQGSVDSFTTSGNPTYDSSGVHFTVAKSGDAPTLTSLFYIMFGKVSISMKCAPGAGIVSTIVLQSDDLDEIDMEWLGADDTEVQTNFFGKGGVTTYNRGAFNPAPNNQGEFVTYEVEWTSDQITWSVGGTVVRVLTPAIAGEDQYPQTPMQVKFGSWSGGDSSNPPGTIAWARGPTDYSQGPFTMSVQSIAITDYSTGTQYKYGDTSGSWQSIQAVGGSVNANLGGAGTPVISASVPAITSASPSIPAGWPWVASTTLATVATGATSAPGLPSGWIITPSGKIAPASSAATSPVSISSLPSAPLSQPSGVGSEITPTLPVSTSSVSQPAQSNVGYVTTTGWDNQGFPTTMTLVSGWQTMSKSYDQQGSLVTSVPSSTTTASGTALGDAPCFGANCGTDGKVVKTGTSNAGAPKRTIGAFLGLAGAVMFL